jgi:nucleoside-diphosphate-sugar epimerase
MKILITGGAGCLGTNLIKHWIPLGHDILVIDNFTTGNYENIPDHSKLSIKEGSIVDFDFLKKCFFDFSPEIVIHAAASYNDPENWERDAYVNILGAINITKCAEKSSILKIINFQTALCYGHPEENPVLASHKTAPFTSYGISKTAGEQYMLLSDVPVLTLRLGNITAPGLSIGPIPTFYKRLKEGKRCFCSDSSRDFLDISDFLTFMDTAIKKDSCGIYNVSTGEPHSMKEVFDIVADHLNLENVDVPIVPVEKNDVQIISLDPQETKSVFEWQPVVGFEDAIRKQLAWYDKHGITNIFSHLKK